MDLCLGSVYHFAMVLQVADFMSGDDDSGESARILDNGHTVDLLKALIHHAGSTDVCESLRIAGKEEKKRRRSIFRLRCCYGRGKADQSRDKSPQSTTAKEGDGTTGSSCSGIDRIKKKKKRQVKEEADDGAPVNIIMIGIARCCCSLKIKKNQATDHISRVSFLMRSEQSEDGGELTWGSGKQTSNWGSFFSLYNLRNVNSTKRKSFVTLYDIQNVNSERVSCVR